MGLYGAYDQTHPTLIPQDDGFYMLREIQGRSETSIFMEQHDKHLYDL